MHYDVTTLALHITILGGIIGILVILLGEHKVWVRMKDRLNVLWRHHKKDIGQPEDYVPVDDKD